ncbi:MAG: transglycosylase SLT domain-containing protein [Candidatus Omnitrophica bacterium]|nr:transglycosylase SLT domain-containing protein [Candidatus Omnitrophota bacterium]
MKKSLFPLFVIFPLIVAYSTLAQEAPYKEIQQAIEGKDYISALNLAKALPEEEGLYLSGILKEKLGASKEAIEFFEKYLEKAKLLADYCFLHIANNYYCLGNFLEAGLWYEKAEILFNKKSISYSQILERLAESYEKINYSEEAIKTYQRLGNDKALFHLATLYRELGRKEKAVETFWRLVKNFPNSPFSVRAINRLESLQKYLSPEEEFSLAYVFYRNRLYRRAEKRFSLLLDQEIPFSLCSKIHYFRGRSLFRLWNYRGALKEYSQVYPENKKISYEKGCTLQKLKRYEEAINEYKKIGNSESLWRVSRCYRELKDYSKAVGALEKILYSFPKKEQQSRAAYFSGKYWEKLGKSERAKVAYSRVAKLPYTFYSYRACQEGKASSPQKQNPSYEKPSPQQNLADLEKRPELKKALFLLRLGIQEEAFLELKNLERKSRGREKILTLIYLYQEARAYPQAIRLGTTLKNKKMRYPLYYQDLVEEYSKKYDLDPFLVFAIIWQESRFGKGDISSASAIGLMQIIPSTGAWIAKRMRRRNYRTTSLFEPKTNIAFGCYYFRHLLNSFDNNIILALSAYNAGPEKTSDWFSKENDFDEFVESIPFSETYNYVKRVISAYQEYQSLYNHRYTPTIPPP